MEMKMMVGFVMVVFEALVVQCVTAQNLHVVGDEFGWTILQGGADAYANWAATQQFMVDDILMFNFTTNDHDVVEVPKESFDSCSGSNPIGSVITRGPANITLVSPGQKYYICTFSQHCNLGQKLAITVSSSSGTTGASPPSATPTTPPATPSPPNSGTPADCAPVPASSPSSGGPTSPATTTPATTTPVVSSSHVVFASFFVSFVSIVVTLLFL